MHRAPESRAAFGHVPMLINPATGMCALCALAHTAAMGVDQRPVSSTHGTGNASRLVPLYSGCQPCFGPSMRVYCAGCVMASNDSAICHKPSVSFRSGVLQRRTWHPQSTGQDCSAHRHLGAALAKGQGSSGGMTSHPRRNQAGGDGTHLDHVAHWRLSRDAGQHAQLLLPAFALRLHLGTHGASR